MRHGPAFQHAMRNVMTKPTVPAPFALMSSSVPLNEEANQQQQHRKKRKPIPVPSEITLHHVPQELRLEYPNMPGSVQAVVWLVSVWLSALLSFQKLRLAWIRPLMALQQTGTVPWRKLFSFAVKAAVLALTFTAVLQDVVLPPSRISTQKLQDDYFLPSLFSRYEPLSLPTDETPKADVAQKVHYLLLEKNGVQDKKNTTGVIYLNHGFGASSLSWLPAMKPLLDAFGSSYQSVLAHDAPGFGFTDRPNDWLEAYTSRGSAAIGSSLLQAQLQRHHHQSTRDLPQKVLLMGHSMGAITTLRMALQLPRNVTKQVILVDPALGIRPNEGKIDVTKKQVRATNLLQKFVLDPLGTYVLRRAVGKPGFWRSGLEFAWGNPLRVSNADVLRFQWPSLGQGWEKGVLRFTRAQFLPMEVSDRQLLEQVLALPNTTVYVIFGGSDKVVKPEKIRDFFAAYPNVRLIELKGLGHDPFEEDTKAFISALNDVL